ncbi:hypothetical protein [Actinomyces polynesiensis]|uniref:hypothetical protein n=1 Tax=Actinomyces polynesiensis TaxID=1325934 RepID=UPI0005BE6D93|nr:hypothetical protein [Actinomyces polynesiensis]
MSEWKTWSLGGTPEEPEGTPGEGSGPGTGGPSSEEAPQQGIDEGGSARGSQEASGSTDGPGDEDQLRWGTEVLPLDLDRLEHVMAEDGFPLARAEFSLTTSVDDTTVRVHREPADSPWMQVETRMALPETTAASLDSGGITPFDLQQVANTWNTTHLQPTVFPGRLDEKWYFFLVSRFFVGAGLSDRQVHLLLRRAVVVGLQAVRDLPGLVPPTATE